MTDRISAAKLLNLEHRHSARVSGAARQAEARHGRHAKRDEASQRTGGAGWVCAVRDLSRPGPASAADGADANVVK